MHAHRGCVVVVSVLFDVLKTSFSKLPIRFPGRRPCLCLSVLLCEPMPASSSDAKTSCRLLMGKAKEIRLELNGCCCCCCRKKCSKLSADCQSKLPRVLPAIRGWTRIFRHTCTIAAVLSSVIRQRFRSNAQSSTTAAWCPVQTWMSESVRLPHHSPTVFHNVSCFRRRR